MPWNPDLYLKFARERTQPSMDLASRLEGSVIRSALDIGCGPGNSTEILRSRFPDATLIGLDSSVDMIKAATQQHDWGTWICSDAESYAYAESFDLIFSNAAFQWFGDQEHVIRSAYAALNPGGSLAVQVPDNADSPMVVLLHELAAEDRYRDIFSSFDEKVSYLGFTFYYDTLTALTQDFEIWVTTYQHVLDSAEAIVQWYQSTGLRPYLKALSDDTAREAFLSDVLKKVRAGYPAQSDGRVVLPFQRLFFIARK